MLHSAVVMQYCARKRNRFNRVRCRAGKNVEVMGSQLVTCDDHAQYYERKKNRFRCVRRRAGEDSKGQ